MIKEFLETFDLLERIRTSLQKKRAYAVAAVVVIAAFVPKYLSSLNLGGGTLSEILPNVFFIRNLTLILAFCELILLVVWRVSRRIYRFKRGELGLLLAIRTDNKKLKIRLKNDFINFLYDEMKPIGIAVSIKTLSEYHWAEAV